ncbi:hypothetical protein DVH24_016037 [Malus domestica]|uniref:Uncharacterized protein n=1 Tax=Malus domestica TaxID=3750 RepID=A0A498JEM9_MALDO|nr:hypothetical protein DVH24_016037 [Malus domestica]
MRIYIYIRHRGSTPLDDHDIVCFELNHALTFLFLRIHTRTSQWVTHLGIVLAQTRLTSKPPPHPGLDSTVSRHCSLWAPTTSSLFCLWNLTRELPSSSPILELLLPNSLNFKVLMEPEANELPKCLVLGKYRNIHIRLTGSTSLDDVGCYKKTKSYFIDYRSFHFVHGFGKSR